MKMKKKKKIAHPGIIPDDVILNLENIVGFRKCMPMYIHQGCFSCFLQHNHARKTPTVTKMPRVSQDFVNVIKDLVAMEKSVLVSNYFLKLGSYLFCGPTEQTVGQSVSFIIENRLPWGCTCFG